MRAVTYTKGGTTTSIAMNTTVTVQGTTKVQFCELWQAFWRPHPCTYACGCSTSRAHLLLN